MPSAQLESDAFQPASITSNSSPGLIDDTVPATARCRCRQCSEPAPDWATGNGRDRIGRIDRRGGAEFEDLRLLAGSGFALDPKALRQR